MHLDNREEERHSSAATKESLPLEVMSDGFGGGTS